MIKKNRAKQGKHLLGVHLILLKNGSNWNGKMGKQGKNFKTGKEQAEMAPKKCKNMRETM